MAFLRCKTFRGRRRGAQKLVWTAKAWLPVVLCLLLYGTRALAGVPREYEVKAAFLLRFTEFTEWPTNAFASPDAPLVIGVLGSDPFQDVLDETVRGEKVGGRPIRVERYRTLAETSHCHILYIGQSERSRLGEIVAALKEKPILTVSDIEGSAFQGVMIRFLTKSGKVQLRINVDAAREANVKLSSKLLRVAAEVIGKDR